MSPTMTATCFFVCETSELRTVEQFRVSEQNKNLFLTFVVPRNVNYLGLFCTFIAFLHIKYHATVHISCYLYFTFENIHRMDSERNQDKQGRYSNKLGWLSDDEVFQGKFSSSISNYKVIVIMHHLESQGPTPIFSSNFYI